MKRQHFLKSAGLVLFPALLMIAFMPAILLGDNGKLTGNVYDAENGEPFRGQMLLLKASGWMEKRPNLTSCKAPSAISPVISSS